jgi:hypothetical protein
MPHLGSDDRLYDGINLYYRALKGTPRKWLDIAAMSAAALRRAVKSSGSTTTRRIFPAESIPMRRAGRA